MAKSTKPASTKKWQAASEKWVQTFAEASEGLGEPRKMFGYPAAFVNGNLFAGLHESGLVLRLPEEDRVELLRLDGASEFAPMGRVMREYVVAPPEMAGKADVVAAWIQRSFDYASSLPPKVKKSAGKPRSK